MSSAFRRVHRACSLGVALCFSVLLACEGRDSSSRTDSAEASPVEAFRAVGNEPFWGLEIDSTGLRFRTPDDTTGMHWPSMSPVVKGDTFRWVGRTERGEIEASIWPARCSDGMSDRTWQYTAAVRIDTTRYEGCAESRLGAQR